MAPDILVAHSNGAVRDVIGGILARQGHRVEMAYNASTAIPILESGAVDAMLVSLHLPPNGFHLVLDAVEDPPPTIVIGEHGHPIPAAVDRDGRVAGVLVRPFALQDLLHVVEATAGAPGRSGTAPETG